MKFPDGFVWGAATSAYQIEGAVDEDGRGPSIWDTFTHTPGKVAGGGTGDVACDHYRRWREDVDLLAELGVNAYRFSIAWPRLFPTGSGRREPRGFAHYDRLIDALLERGIEPLVTLYHWDLPQALQDEGGWQARETVERFADYARACYEAYGDRVKRWLTINEPWIVGLLGYFHGLHAPGVEGDVRGEVTCFHHLLLAHGRAVQELRAVRPEAQVGIVLSLSPHYPLTDEAADVAATHASDEYVNRWFLDAVLTGAYPTAMRERYEAFLGPLDFVRDRDLETIATPSDYLGVNYYARRVMRAAAREPYAWDVVVADETPKTEAGTEITPDAFTDLLLSVHDDYGVPLLITENGAVFSGIHDPHRVQYIRDHLAAVHRALERGANVLGYCHWSFLDNLEWAFGYGQRFGLVHVDYATQRRTIKDSGRYYAEMAGTNEVAP